MKNGETAKGGRGGVREVWGVGEREQCETTRNYTRREETKTAERREGEGKNGERAKEGKRGGMRVGEGWTGR